MIRCLFPYMSDLLCMFLSMFSCSMCFNGSCNPLSPLQVATQPVTGLLVSLFLFSVSLSHAHFYTEFPFTITPTYIETSSFASLFPLVWLPVCGSLSHTHIHNVLQPSKSQAPDPVHLIPDDIDNSDPMMQVSFDEYIFNSGAYSFNRSVNDVSLLINIIFSDLSLCSQCRVDEL